MKTCAECHIMKDESEFSRTLKFKRLRSRCIACTKKRLSTISRAWQLRNPKKSKAGAYRTRFQLNFDALWEAQGGLCAVCGKPMQRGGREPDSVCADHDRKCCPGLVHRNCNLALGYAKDDKDVLRHALAYLERWEATHPLIARQ